MATKVTIKFSDVKYKQIYLEEIWFLANSIIRRVKRLDDLAKVPESGYLFFSKHEITELILGILSNSANIKKLTNPGKQAKGESAGAFQFRVDRCNFIKNSFPEIDFLGILDTKLRNTLEHFDEYLDDFMTTIAKGEFSHAYPMVALNFGLSDQDAFEPHLYPIRMYESKTKNFYNFDNIVNIKSIYDVATAIDEKLKCEKLKLIQKQYILNPKIPAGSLGDGGCAGGMIIPRNLLCDN
ncbi:hypothetical protein [Klebsiella michiganensis]|uniref:hypothetical protein n=1 Tax=Klebsiella michiganensis TaxID=1134687 RepID=UPI000C9BF5F3|nr:hypothetical protein [Klebsiella michiganensis]